MSHLSEHERKVNLIKAAFFRSFRPPSRFEDTKDFVRLAMDALDDETMTEADRHRKAIRYLSCVPAIHDRLPKSALNEILGRQGVAVPA